MHSVQLAWKGAQGAVHHFEPVPISEGFYERITKDGQLTIRQTEISYRENEPTQRPMILADVPAPSWREQVEMGAGIVLLLVGLGLLGSAARFVARQK